MPDYTIKKALARIDELLEQSFHYQTLIRDENWNELEEKLQARQNVLESLFQEFPQLADNPVAAVKIRELLALDAQSVTVMQDQRDSSDHELGELKRNADAVKRYIAIEQQSN